MTRRKQKLGILPAESLYPFPWEFRRERYDELYLMSCVQESKVQSSIITLLKNYRVEGFPIDAGGRRARGAMMAAGKAAGISVGALCSVKTGGAIPKGFADLESTLAPDGRSLYIEVKAPMWCDVSMKVIRQAGFASQEQLDFLSEKHKRGAVVMVAWSAQDVVEFLGPLLVANRKALIG